MASDPNSLSNVDEYKCFHLDWEINADFATSTLQCEASYSVKCLIDTDQSLILDTSELSIESVTVNNKVANFELQAEQKPFGKALLISIEKENQIKGKKFDVCVSYKTSPKATAIQWLPQEQTIGKKHPYLFTQCQAIHARSMLPCQDSPGNKFTYTAKVTVPDTLVALMSAVKGDETLDGSGRKTCHFNQKVPIPSYLMAIAIGPLESRVVGPRSKVWCEGDMVEACAYEFANLEDMLATAESLLGPYIWGQYDLLVLPPSFPYGGMENPCLTFVTPTVVAGDRSLNSVAVHEITHSWTGNLVTNKTWEHFWLNEGFTRFIEGKIVGLLEGEEVKQIMAIEGWQHLINTINTFGANNKLTNLQPCLKGIDPDDAFSSVPYEKGYALLYYIETLVGGKDVFNVFLKNYVNEFKFKTVVTQDFKDYLLNYFKDKETRLNEVDWEAWLFTPGMPPVDVCDFYDKTPTKKSKELCEKWINAKSVNDVSQFDATEFSSLKTLQKIDFLTKLYQQPALELPMMEKLGELYELDKYNNAEIRFAFLRLAVRSKWENMYDNAITFAVEIGRMKFTRPLYREMYANESLREKAIKTFQENRHFYNLITANMVLKDLKLTS